jgi:hypothetical protein
MRLISLLAAPAAALLLSALPAAARLLIEIDKSSQSMTVSRDGAALHRWPVSTGIRRYDTPSGNYTPFRMEKDHFSREWDDAPMPHSIFFTKVGHAIHGTNHLRAIGRPASHGCVRLLPENARVLFDLVRRERMANTRVVLHGDTPPAQAPALVRAPRTEQRPGYGQRPGYIARPDRDVTTSAPGGRGEPVPTIRGDARDGYWVQYPDGTRVFVKGDRAAAEPPPFFLGGPFGGH